MEDFINKMAEFSVSVYGNLEKYNDVISKARVRIFYKYGNRNGSYITDDFADKLLNSLPYTPIKGIYVDDDYTDHGTSRTIGRIYGIVPENPNVQWESHIDNDGVERVYACADVLLFTGLYPEANEIVDKAQSMEIYQKSIDGEWQIIDGQKYFVFTEGCFLGLQVLGENVEPCFEGAAFFTFVDSLNTIIKKIEQYNLDSQGEQIMPELLFKISDDEKYRMIWSLLNTELDEDGYVICKYALCAIYDDYAIAFNRYEGQYYRVYYTKNDDTDSLVIDKLEKCFIIDVNEAEKAALDALRQLNNDTYELVDETFSQLQEKNSQYEQKIVELEESIVTLNTDKDNFCAQFNEATNLLNEAKSTIEEARENLSTLQAQNEELMNFKKAVELSEKQTVIESYVNMLPQEILDTYSTSLDNYTVEELDKELAYELKKVNPSVFGQQNIIIVPKDDAVPVSGVETILKQYIK